MIRSWIRTLAGICTVAALTFGVTPGLCAGILSDRLTIEVVTHKAHYAPSEPIHIILRAIDSGSPEIPISNTSFVPRLYVRRINVTPAVYVLARIPLTPTSGVRANAIRVLATHTIPAGLSPGLYDVVVYVYLQSPDGTRTETVYPSAVFEVR